MNTIKTLLEAINISILHDSDAEIAEGVRIMQMAEEITGAEIITLRSLYEHGPLEDGEVPNKVEFAILTEEGLANRIIQLTEKGLASRIIQKGKRGYNACTDKGAQLILLLVARGTIKISE